MIGFGYRVQITSLDGKFTQGTIEPGGYRFEALIFDQPSQWGLNGGRISKLHIKDKADRPVVEYDRGFAVDKNGRPERHSFTQTRLIKAMTDTFPSQMVRTSAQPARRVGAEASTERLGLDKHTLADRPHDPPPQKLFVPHQRVRFNGFSCTMPPGCPDPETFKRVTKQLVRERFGSEEKAVAALRAYEGVLDTKGQFAGYPKAVQRYQEARVLASPAAQEWKDFLEDHHSAFADYDEDGRDKDPAIPGWSAYAVNFQSAESERGERIDAAKARTPAPRSDEGREID